MSFEAIHWTEWLKAFGPALIASFVAFIAYQQWHLSRATLREKLFNRRMEIYHSVHLSLSEFTGSGEVTHQSIALVQKDWRESRFLFGNEVSQFLDSLQNRMVEAYYHKKVRHDGMTSEDKSYHIDKELEHKKWLVNQFDPLFKVFSPYLTFDQAF